MTSADTPILEVKDMCKNFGVTVALNHVNLTLKRGEIRGLIGENGSGKSTVSSIVAGMQKQPVEKCCTMESLGVLPIHWKRKPVGFV